MSDFKWSDILDAVVNGTTINGVKPGAPANETLSVPKVLGWESGKLQAEWTILENLHNSRGELFGGYYSVLADVALSYTAMTVLNDDERFKTVDLRVSWFRPATTGTITIDCEVINRSRSFVHTEALFKNPAGKLLCKVAVTFAIVPA